MLKALGINYANYSSSIMKRLMNYDEAVEYIDNIVKFTAKNSLDHTRKCLEMLGHPEENFEYIHIAGTNGKGSTCAFLSSIMEKSGRKTGLFVSPHLVRINERFRINGKDIGDELFLEGFKRIKKLSDELQADGEYHPTYFEFLFLMAVWIFAKEKVEIAIFETGLGGRLDATNALASPLATVITEIGMDHMKYLGDTKMEIAREKAGIIKPGVPVIFDDNCIESRKAVMDKAEELCCQFYPLSESNPRECTVADKGHGVKPRRYGKEGVIDFSMPIEYYGNAQFTVPFPAKYQVKNGALTLLTLYALKDKLPCKLSDIRAGLLEVRWSGRMQEIKKDIFIDGAHNEDGINEFIHTAASICGNRKCSLLFGVMSDKDFSPMVKELVERLAPVRVTTTTVEPGRGESAGALADMFAGAVKTCSTAGICPDIKYQSGEMCSFEETINKARIMVHRSGENVVRDKSRREGSYEESGFTVKGIDDPRAALEYALSRQGDTILFIVGSLYLAGEALKYFGEKHDQF